MKKAGLDPQTGQADDGSGFRYPEWDNRLQDYLRDHVRVQESLVMARGDGDFYRQSLEHYRGMVARIRRAFEFLKPEGLVMLRQWPDGDAFDHRALIDFAVDRRAGRTPFDRLFIKRLKQERDVAALLLVDLSRSTANPVVDRHGNGIGSGQGGTGPFLRGAAGGGGHLRHRRFFRYRTPLGGLLSHQRLRRTAGRAG